MCLFFYQSINHRHLYNSGRKSNLTLICRGTLRKTIHHWIHFSFGAPITITRIHRNRRAFRVATNEWRFFNGLRLKCLRIRIAGVMEWHNSFGKRCWKGIVFCKEDQIASMYFNDRLVSSKIKNKQKKPFNYIFVIFQLRFLIIKFIITLFKLLRVYFIVITARLFCLLIISCVFMTIKLTRN